MARTQGSPTASELRKRPFVGQLRIRTQFHIGTTQFGCVQQSVCRWSATLDRSPLRGSGSCDRTAVDHSTSLGRREWGCSSVRTLVLARRNTTSPTCDVSQCDHVPAGCTAHHIRKPVHNISGPVQWHVPGTTSCYSLDNCAGACGRSSTGTRVQSIASTSARLSGSIGLPSSRSIVSDVCRPQCLVVVPARIHSRSAPAGHVWQR